MRILHVTAQRPDSTGSGVYLAETLRAFAAQGCEQAVVAGVGPTDRSPFPPDVVFVPVRFETPGLPFPVVGMSDVMPYASTRYRDLTPEMASQFKSAFEAAFDDVFARFSPEIIICHHLYLACGVLMDWLARHPEKRAACSVRGVSHNTDIRQFCAHGLEREFITRGVRMLDYVFALHDAQAREIAQVYGIDLDQIRVVGTGYDDGLFTPAPSSRDGKAHGRGACIGQTHDGKGTRPPTPAPNGGNPEASMTSAKRTGRVPIRLLYVGKLWKQKGLMNLMGALDLLPSNLAGNMILEMVGGHSDEAERADIVARARKCQVDVSFLGLIRQAELVEAYRRADLFVLPSFSEGLPLVVIEALACGCKVVVSDLPGVRDWFFQYVPSAPVRYVRLPAMGPGGLEAGPEPDEAGRFEKELASAIEASLHEPYRACDLSALTWSSLASRLVS